MPRVRSRTAHKRRRDWPLSPEDDLARGIAPERFTVALASLQASSAQARYDRGDVAGAVNQLQLARGVSDRWAARP